MIPLSISIGIVWKGSFPNQIDVSSDALLTIGFFDQNSHVPSPLGRHFSSSHGSENDAPNHFSVSSTSGS